MKKIILPFALSTALLVGCGNTSENELKEQKEAKIVGELKNVEVIKKVYKARTRSSPAEYSVIVGHDGQEIELRLFSEDAYRVLNEGTVVNVHYTDKYFIKEMSFPKLEDESEELYGE
jgi:hypothetical protein